MKSKLLMGLSVSLLPVIFSCSKKDTPAVPGKVPTIYIVGSVKYGDGDERGVLWRDSNVVVLESKANAYFTDVFIEGDDVYVCGGEDEKSIAYWKNGTQTVITSGMYEAGASAIFVQNGDVYVAGYEKNAARNNIAKYWKNGKEVLLSENSFHGDASDIMVKGNDVYVAGRKDGKLVYWKNGEAIVVSNDNNASPRKIFIDKEDVYIVGTLTNSRGIIEGVYWKNGVQTSVTEGRFASYLSDIVVHNGDIYVSGSESQPGKSIAKFWKNGKEVVVSNPTSRSAYVSGIAVSGSHVFAIVTENTSNFEHVVNYWYNGKTGGVGDITKSAWGGAVAVKTP